MEALARSLRVSPAVKEKANELLRLADAKGSISMQQTCLEVVCLHLACKILSEPVDKKQFQKYSGKSADKYAKSVQLVEKLLNLDSGGTIQDLVIRFGCPEAKDTAEEILTSYKKYFADNHISKQYQSMNFNTGLYSAVVLYIACSLLDIRIDRSKLISAVSSSGRLFRSYHEDIKKSIPESLVERVKRMKETKGKKKSRRTIKDDQEVTATVEGEAAGDDDDLIYLDWPVHFQQESWESRCLYNPISSQFKSWKTEILSKATSKSKKS